jgi:hypothetical protein
MAFEFDVEKYRVIELEKAGEGESNSRSSSNLQKVGWAGSASEYPLFIQFHAKELKSGKLSPATGYVYQAPSDVYYKILAGVDAPDLHGDEGRRSIGRVFYDEVVRAKLPYVKVF